MGLIQNNNKYGAGKININDDVRVDYGKKKKYTSKDRFTLKIDPETYEVLKALQLMSGKHLYTIVDDIAQDYVKQLSEDDQRTFKSLLNITHKSVVQKQIDKLN